MKSWPALIAVAIGLMAAPQAQADPAADAVAAKEAAVTQLRQRADALKAALAGDVCADPQAGRALLKATPTAAQAKAKPISADVGVLSRKDLVDRLHQSVVLVIAEKNTGSGFFVTPDIVVTNNHVIEGAGPGPVIVVGRGLPKPLQAQIIARTNSSGENARDYAILRVQGGRAGAILPLETDVQELSKVVAAGFPGLLLTTDMSFQALLRGDMKAMPELALSQGAVMAVQNRGRGLPIIAHSALISAGNSGGPLVDPCGHAIGINTFINVAVEQASSAGFAQTAGDLSEYLRANGITPTTVSTACDVK